MYADLEIIHPGACPGLRLTNGPLPPWQRSRQACLIAHTQHSSLQLLPAQPRRAQQGCQGWGGARTTSL